MDNNMVSNICVRMSTANIHLPQFKVESHLQKHELRMPVYQVSYLRKTV